MITERAYPFFGKAKLLFEQTDYLVTALDDLGKEEFYRNGYLTRITELIQKEDLVNLKHDIKLAPEWIAPLTREIILKALAVEVPADFMR